MTTENPKADYSEELLHKIQQYNSELEQRIQEHVEDLREEVESANVPSRPCVRVSAGFRPWLRRYRRSYFS